MQNNFTTLEISWFDSEIVHVLCCITVAIQCFEALLNEENRAHQVYHWFLFYLNTFLTSNYILISHICVKNRKIVHLKIKALP